MAVIQKPFRMMQKNAFIFRCSVSRHLFHAFPSKAVTKHAKFSTMINIPHSTYLSLACSSINFAATYRQSINSKKYQYRHSMNSTKHQCFSSIATTSLLTQHVNSGGDQKNSQDSEPEPFGLLLFLKQFVFWMITIHMIRLYAFDIIEGEGPSMMPTLNSSGDWLLVELFTVKTFPQLKMFYESIINRANFLTQRIDMNLQPGDIVIASSPQHPYMRLCKRVIALPGEKVFVTRRTAFGTYTERVSVPKGHVWVQGDNTSNSNDSRNYGPIPQALISGRVIAKVWPLREISILRRDLSHARDALDFKNNTLYDDQGCIDCPIISDELFTEIFSGPLGNRAALDSIAVDHLATSPKNSNSDLECGAV